MSGFIRISIEIRDEDEDTLLARKKDICTCLLSTSQISSIRPTKDGKETEIFMSGGEMYILSLGVEDVEGMLEECERIYDFEYGVN